MRIGDIAKTTHLRVYFDGLEARGWTDQGVKRGYQMVVLYLGCEPKNGSDPLDPERMLNLLGWKQMTPEEHAAIVDADNETVKT